MAKQLNLTSFFHLGLFSVFLGRWGLYISLSLIGPSRASMIKNFSPVFTIFLAFFIFGQWPDFIPLLGIWIILCGLWVLAKTANNKRIKQSPDNSWNRKEWNKGVMLGLMVALMFSISDILRALSVSSKPEFIVGAAFSILGGWFGMATILLVKGRFISIYSQYKTYLNKDLILASVYAGAAQVTTFIAVSYLFVPYVSALIATSPFMTALFSRLLSKNDENFGLFFWISMSLMISGAMLISIFS